ncbi:MULTISPECIES: 50S ribosomal protein L25/general stress protein Ctc [Sporosarcina]|uniref:Large ribosomal subunit protein bL25 n=1 Tax=Sporosarcina psychrophila TaxID=1476 RepID=A0ABV2KES1_SPOPS|nr:MULTISPECIES: 50S ribosomal protein L25/general stress protein Ctc [Sporosarcina]AMQ08329.1 50S ribosomal protein L25/general stress protein Ctc [Sporosarcina psychrophila]QNK88149.1 50S ribosomal protein L25/general stress protein Ctc [Sporosarcina sp. resist]
MSTTIQSEARVPSKQSALTGLRKEGYVPAVVYGYKTEATSISVKERDLLKTLQITGRNGVIKLNIDGKDLNVVLNDYQSDVLKGEIRHADFLAINMTEELEVDVTIHLIGESVGLKEGGVLQQPNREVTIKVKPSDIPETFDIDISKLQIGETITVAEIRANSKYEILNEDDHALVLISSPRTAAEMEELESEASESEEPEVIGEKKEAK